MSMFTQINEIYTIDDLVQSHGCESIREFFDVFGDVYETLGAISDVIKDVIEGCDNVVHLSDLEDYDDYDEEDDPA